MQTDRQTDTQDQLQYPAHTVYRVKNNSAIQSTGLVYFCTSSGYVRVWIRVRVSIWVRVRVVVVNK